MRIGTHAAIVALLVVLTSGSSTHAQQRNKPPSEVVATVGSLSVTMAQVDERAMRTPAGTFGSMPLSEAVYEARRAALEDIIDNILIDQDAKERGIDRSEVLEQEIRYKMSQPTDADIAAWFQSNQARLKGASLDQARAQIRAYLIEERARVAREAYLDRLRRGALIRVSLEPPRQVVTSKGRPAKGPASAPIELIEFSDFQCPFCSAAFPTVQRVLSTYGDQIRFVYRHYPQPNHPNARPAAEAAECAAEQGQFWPYHDRLFGDQTRLSNDALKVSAAQLGLDPAKFNACFDSRRYKGEVDKDIREANQAGSSGTPTFFINGRMLSGAQPFEAFKRVIDQELRLRKK
jgi:protein-disulfide isomerase